MAVNLIGFECQCEFEVFAGVSGKFLKVLEQEGDVKLVTLWKLIRQLCVVTAEEIHGKKQSEYEIQPESGIERRKIEK